MTDAPVIYTDLSQRKSAVALAEAATVLVDKAAKYDTILADADAALVAELRARVNDQIKKLDEERLEMTKGARETVAMINSKFKVHIDALQGQLTRIDRVIKDYLRRKETEAKEAERLRQEAAAKLAEEQAAAQAAAEAELLKAQKAETAEDRERALTAAAQAATQVQKLDKQLDVTLQAPAPAAPTKITGVAGSKLSNRENWTWRVTDIGKVPEAYMIPPVDRLDRKVLDALAKSQKDRANVPGIEFFNDPILATRASK